VYLSQSQQQFIRENCSQAVGQELCLIKYRPPCAKVMSVVKVRHRDYTHTTTEVIIEKLIGIKGVLSKSIEVDWVQSQSSVYVLPFDGYDWRPTVFDRTDSIANSLEPLLLEQIITDRFSQVTNMKYATASKTPMHLFGVSKYVAIRTVAYPKFDTLLDQLS